MSGKGGSIRSFEVQSVSGVTEVQVKVQIITEELGHPAGAATILLETVGAELESRHIYLEMTELEMVQKSH